MIFFVTEPSNWSLLGEDNLFMVAATAGLIVFVLVISSAIAIVVCMHRHRTHSFKGFGTGTSMESAGTPQRFKLDRPHLLESNHSSPDGLIVDDFIMSDSRSKTATLTAGYRMTPRNNGTIIGGTLSKSYRALHQNPYTSAGSIYGESGGGSSSNGSNNGSRPFLVSYASSNLYAEPDYNCISSNHSGDQLTGSTIITNTSLTSANTNNPNKPPPPPPFFPNSNRNSELLLMESNTKTDSKQTNKK